MVSGFFGFNWPADKSFDYTQRSGKIFIRQVFFKKNLLSK